MAIANVEKAKRVLPSDFDQIIAVTRVEFLRNLRRKRLLIFAIIIALVSALVLAVPLFFDGYPKGSSLSPYIFAQNFMAGISFLTILLAVFYGGDALVSEFSNKTGYAIFPNPIRRSSLFVGKLFASLLACFLILGSYYIIIAVSMLAVYSTLVIELLYSFLFALLYMSACLGVAFAISALMRSTVSALVLTFVLFLFVLSMLSGILMFARVRAEPLLTFQVGVISGFLSGPYPGSYPPPTERTFIPVDNRTSFEFVTYNPTVVNGIIVCIIWLIVSLSLAYFVFRRREMLG